MNGDIMKLILIHFCFYVYIVVSFLLYFFYFSCYSFVIHWFIFGIVRVRYRTFAAHFYFFIINSDQFFWFCCLNEWKWFVVVMNKIDVSIELFVFSLQFLSVCRCHFQASQGFKSEMQCKLQNRKKKTKCGEI